MSGWTAESIRNAKVMMAAAHLSTAMNESAALFYTRVTTATSIIMGVLTIMSASASLPLSSPASVTNQALGIVQGVSGFALGILANITVRMDWHGRAKALITRASGYSKLHALIRAELSLANHERNNYREFIMGVVTEFAALEALTDPLPIRYKRDTRINESIMAMWGGTGASSYFDITAREPEPAPEPAPTPTPDHEAIDLGVPHESFLRDVRAVLFSSKLDSGEVASV